MSPASVHRTLETALVAALVLVALLEACGALTIGVVRRAGSGGPQRVWAGA